MYVSNGIAKNLAMVVFLFEIGVGSKGNCYRLWWGGGGYGGGGGVPKSPSFVDLPV